MNVNHPSTRTLNFRQARLLVVEDTDDHWHLIRMEIQRALPEVMAIRVATQEQAIVYLNSCLGKVDGLPKMVLLDLYLPDRQTGWQLLQQIKHPQSAFRQLPVVVFSHSNTIEDIRGSYRYGSTSFVTKPLDPRHWSTYFKTLRTYWWETATLPGN
jgi:CheY-like chemotaxis protein